MKIPNGASYSVERAASPASANLPQNSDLKMVDGDVARYAIEGCELEVALEFAPDRCDVYVQADEAGTLIGYAFVYGGSKDSRFRTITTLNATKQPGGGVCYLRGAIYDAGAQHLVPVANLGRDFEGRHMYSVWRNDAGEDLVSEVDPNADSTNNDEAFGVWYISKHDDKLRIRQERWNYCYKDTSVIVDDVFYRLVTLRRVAN